MKAHICSVFVFVREMLHVMLVDFRSRSVKTTCQSSYNKRMCFQFTLQDG